MFLKPKLIFIRLSLVADVKPWARTHGLPDLASNYATGMVYSGMNPMLRSLKQGFIDSRWMTYKQVIAESGQVRKGEHGTTAIFYTMLERENDE